MSDQISALHSFIVESNYFLRLLNGLAKRPAIPAPVSLSRVRAVIHQWQIANPDLRGTVFDEVPLSKLVDSWFGKLEAAYADADDETRISLAAIAGLFGSKDAIDERYIIGLVRDPLGLLLRKFEAKLLDVERRLAALVTGGQAGKSLPPMDSVLTLRKLDTKANRIVKFLRKSSASKTITEIHDRTGFDRGTVRNRLKILIENGLVAPPDNGRYTPTKPQ